MSPTATVTTTPNPRNIPTTQTAALVHTLGGPVSLVSDYPVTAPGPNEVLAKVLYTGVCQSDLHTRLGTAAGADGRPIRDIKLPHVGGHEGVGRIVALGASGGSGGSGCDEDGENSSSGRSIAKNADGRIRVGALVGIRFASRVCRRCGFCLAGAEQYCEGRGPAGRSAATNHLHHEDGSFQEYVVLDADYLTLLPDDVDPVVMGPVLCAGLTAYKAVKNAAVRAGDHVVVIGAGGGLGHFAVQYARAQGASVIAVDGGAEKGGFLRSIGAQAYVDYLSTSNVVDEVQRIIREQQNSSGASAVIVTAGSAAAFAQAADMLKVGGTLCCVGIPPGGAGIPTPISTIVIKGLRIVGSLTGSLGECMEAVDLVRRGFVRPHVVVRPFADLPDVYEEMEKGQISGRVVLKVAGDE